MNKPLAVWGLLLFIGFLATHYIVFSLGMAIYAIPLWIVLAAIGAACCCRACKPRKGKGKCSCACCSGIWAVAAVEGIVLTAAILIQLLSISPYYILSVWLLVAGSAAVAESLASRKLVELQLGVFWLFSAVFFPFVNNYQYSTFIIGALVFGVALMLAGIVKKD